MNRYYVNGLFQDAEPTNDVETIIYDELVEISRFSDLTGNEMTLVESSLRRVAANQRRITRAAIAAKQKPVAPATNRKRN
jgi:hypothetical protein